MAVWGKIFGGVTGFMVGGPVGALFGTALGHAADNGRLLQLATEGINRPFNKMGGSSGIDPGGATMFIAAKMAALAGKKDQLYGLCLIILAAKLAKCDGPVNRQEINGFKRHLRIPADKVREVGRLFDLARQRSDDYEKYIREVAQAFSDQKGMLENMLMILFAVARADAPPTGDLNPQELAFLQQFHRLCGLSRTAWNRAEAGGGAPTSMQGNKAYAVFGLPSSASNEELRARWRELVRQNHPDRLSASGADTQTVAKAAEKMALINAAWDYIKKERDL